MKIIQQQQTYEQRTPLQIFLTNKIPNLVEKFLLLIVNK